MRFVCENWFFCFIMLIRDQESQKTEARNFPTSMTFTKGQNPFILFIITFQLFFEWEGLKVGKNANSIYFWTKNGIFSNFDGAPEKKRSVYIYEINYFFYSILQPDNSACLYWKLAARFSSTAKKHQKCRKIYKFVKKIIQINIMLYTIASINLIVIFIRRYNLRLSLNNYPEFQVSLSRFKQSAYVICITFWQFPIKNHYNFLTLNIHDNESFKGI